MLRVDISGWLTILARIYFGEGYTVAIFVGGGFTLYNLTTFFDNRDSK